jgi:hypothetical protein
MRASLAEEADIMLAGYRTGYYTIDDVMAWADRWILALNEPPTATLDLSVGRHLHPREVTRLMRSLGKNDGRSIIDAELGMIGARLLAGTMGVIEASELLWPLHDHPDATDDDVSVAYVGDEICYALNEGIGSLEEIYARLCRFLSPYVDRLKLPDSLPTGND